MENLNAFLESAFGTIIVCLLGWIGTQLWSLKKQGILDRAKLEIDIKKLEHEVRFRKVYDKVSDILIELAPTLMKAPSDFRTFINDLERADTPSKSDQWKNVAASYNGARACLHDNRLLIPKPIFIQVDEFIKTLKSTIDKYKSGKRNAERLQGSGEYEDHTAMAEDALKALEPGYAAIHDAMQMYLGIPAE